ncbi:radical SAM family heme chaperone HemW [Diplocloster modestus]|uniref:Heme chaperone HemW n=1 Tax=Diplocloster modestus TaxID=2850322 RepID=A0ABS6KEV7_9FIRM|nr:radical SAM family heme chaperone HemW [Diplocloster modestus]MBU9729065.1 radical SAM family heme chaperone HemW [Diplocloster modestus]
MKKDLSVYIHIPFCVKKCGYCDFLSMSGSEEEQERYVRTLLQKMERTREAAGQYRVNTIFFGGGTPSILPAPLMGKLMDKLYDLYEVEPSAEITIEANPGTLTPEKLVSYRKMGINRLSIGLQSTKNEELKLLGRIHTYEEFLENYEQARKAGFENINIDLMSGLPGQSRESWKQTLKKAAALHPQHISAYGLMIEEETPFYLLYKDDVTRRERGEEPKQLPTEEAEREMYYDTAGILAEFGYRRYEISNYARPGYECRHNITYWKRGDYLGYGLGAASLMENQRFTVTKDMQAYLTKKYVYEDLMTLSAADQIEEFMFLGLRMMEGISLGEFHDQFHRSFWDIYASVFRKLEDQGLLIREKNRIFLSDKGIDVSNYVMASFLM